MNRQHIFKRERQTSNLIALTPTFECRGVALTSPRRLININAPVSTKRQVLRLEELEQNVLQAQNADL